MFKESGAGKTAAVLVLKGQISAGEVNTERLREMLRDQGGYLR